jgi:hypothetical protein
MQWCPCGLRVRGGRSVGECLAQRVTVSWALVCVNGFRVLWVRPDVLRLNAFGRGGTGVACYREEVHIIATRFAFPSANGKAGARFAE